jgi:threonine dehydrogenase-like Zn-dependent dehydrogenase
MSWSDLIASRLETALEIGAEGVINSAQENLAQHLVELHGAGPAMFPGKADTDIYLDAAGVPAVVQTAVTMAKKGATIAVVAVHKEPVPADFLSVMSNEITVLGSMGYPDEIFDVTTDLVANWQKYARIISHTIPFARVDEALATAATPGAADKIVVTFD